jgi:predicted GNAT family N-acyltransferase
VSASIAVVELAAVDTHDLRRRVLRSGVPATDVEFAEDTWPGVVHLGLRHDGELVAISSWVPRPAPPEADAATAVSPVQLRGMATATHLQGAGLGGRLLEDGCTRMAATGSGLVWARARDAALDFYLRHGFEVRGDGFIDANTQLPHHLVVRPLP